jgi:DNA-binding FrmR family transcriptional regulator
MSHIGQDKKILNRVKRLKGQINSIENAIEQPKTSCIDILQQVAAVKGAINGLMGELMEQHLHSHVLKDAEIDQSELDEFLKVLKRYG